ncbi:hypothetical protein BGZ60DRAFT_520257 [Tricladium varicosporioides]|nr:hypothetical protein BGZ60DRAFT_520257 [Hymenoscyphus varicosporioides]
MACLSTSKGLKQIESFTAPPSDHVLSTMGLGTEVRRAKNKLLNRHPDFNYVKSYDANGLELEQALKRASPSTNAWYLSQIRGASGSLAGLIMTSIQSAFLPQFIVPAVFNFAFLGEYTVQIYTVRKWAKSNLVELAKTSQVFANILAGIIIKVCINLITLGHADFAFIMAAIDTKVGVLLPNQMVPLLDRAHSLLTSNRLVEGLNVALGLPLNASKESLGLVGKDIYWGQDLSSTDITELGFANQAGDSLAKVIVEEPIDKGFAIVDERIAGFTSSCRQDGNGQLGKVLAFFHSGVCSSKREPSQIQNLTYLSPQGPPPSQRDRCRTRSLADHRASDLFPPTGPLLAAALYRSP